MDKQRKIRCDCGNVLAEGTATFGHIVTETMVCGKCSFTTLTKEQAQKFVKLTNLAYPLKELPKCIFQAF